MIEVQAPGKLFIVGEYAILEPGEPAVLVAVDRFLRVRLQPGDKPVDFERSPHVDAAIEVVEELRETRGLLARPFSLDIRSELQDESGRKFGLGSSAAVTVAVIRALDLFYRLGLDPVQRFKLALLSTIAVSPKASGGDIAASTFGGWIRYTSPDRRALAEQRAAHGVEAALECEAWQDFTLRRLPEPSGLELLVGWTGSPASTELLVDEVGAGGDRPQPHAALDHRAFLDQSRDCVDEFVRALEQQPSHDRGQAADARSAVRRARLLLLQLGETNGISIETEALRMLCDVAERHGGAAKPSGAGGGDCGIVLAGPMSDTEGILREWEAHGIVPLNLAVHAPTRTAEGDRDER